MQQHIEDNEKARRTEHRRGLFGTVREPGPVRGDRPERADGATTLQKLTDRFAVQVALSDKDVESVVREVILRKRPEHVPASSRRSTKSAARSTAISEAPSSP